MQMQANNLKKYERINNRVKRKNFNYSDIFVLYMDEKPFENLVCSQYLELMKDFDNMLIEHISDGKDFSVGLQGGTIVVRKFKMNPASYRSNKVNFAHLHYTGEKQYHNNIHSKRYIANIMWLKMSGSDKLLGEYLFKPSAPFKAKVSKKMKDSLNHNRYIETKITW